MRDDSELLRLYADERSDEAFAELVRRHIGSVYSVAKRRVGGDAHLAEDVAQEVFTDLARKAAPLSRRETLVGWLFVAARFASAKAVSRDKQRQSLWRKAQQMIERSDNSTSEPAWEEIRPVLDDAIHELNERDREAVLLHFFDRKSFVDMGPTLRITESGARMRVERALEKLRLSLTYKAISQATKDLDQAINSLIGVDANEKLEALKGTTFYNSGNSVDESALDMEDAGVPLSAEQAQALAQILHNVSTPATNPDSGAPGFSDADPTTWLSPLDQQLFAKAASVLTPNQLQILKTSRSESNQQEAIINQYRSSSDEAVMITN
jgi:RNA polymerase sigma factor (sigma-70 family)